MQAILTGVDRKLDQISSDNDVMENKEEKRLQVLKQMDWNLRELMTKAEDFPPQTHHFQIFIKNVKIRD